MAIFLCLGKVLQKQYPEKLQALGTRYPSGTITLNKPCSLLLPATGIFF
jgi:hypothetical protein